MEHDRYLEYIPFTWAAANPLEGAHYRSSFLREMMVILMLSYQADEYMESVVSTVFGGLSIEARKLIDDLFNDQSLNGLSNGSGPNGLTDFTTADDHMDDGFPQPADLDETPTKGEEVYKVL